MSYICSIKLKTVINMETKKFAEENAGKFFRFHNEIVKVVGYSKGWSSKMFAPRDKVLKQSVYDSYWYVSQTALEEVL